MEVIIGGVSVDVCESMLCKLHATYSGNSLRILNRDVLHPLKLRMCGICQQTKSLTEENFKVKKYYYNPDGTIKNIGYYAGCSCCMLEVSKANRLEVKKDIRRYSKRMVAVLRHRAKSINVPFNLTKEHLIEQWEKQQATCYYTGETLDLSLPSNGNYPHRKFPSLDRRVPTEGYVIGNVVWTTYEVNRMKNDLTENEFLALSEIIYRRRCEN